MSRVDRLIARAVALLSGLAVLSGGAAVAAASEDVGYTPAKRQSHYRVVLLDGVNVDLRGRIDGYLRGTHWRSVGGLNPEGETPDGAGPLSRSELSSLAVATEERRAQAAVWVVRPTPRQLQVHIFDPSTGTTGSRDIPIQVPDDPLSLSAAYETVALVVHLTLQNVQLALEERASIATSQPLPVKDQPAPPARSTEDSSSLGFQVQGGWRGYLDGSSVRQGPELSLGLTLGDWWFGGSSQWLLGRQLESTILQADSTLPSATLAFDLQELAFGLSAGYLVRLPFEWRWGVGGGAVVTHIRRAQAQTSDVLAARAETTELAAHAEIHASLVSSRMFSSGPRWVLAGGGALFVRRPRWVLASGSELPIAWGTLQPWLSASLQFQWDRPE